MVESIMTKLEVEVRIEEIKCIKASREEKRRNVYYKFNK